MRPPNNQPWPDVPATRRRLMSAILGRDTKPELTVRRLLHRLGYRFRVNMRQFSARPDILFPARHKAIFVNGCFWHGHEACRSGRTPKTRREYWGAKLAANKARDARVLEELRANGWESLVLWECQLRDEAALADRLTDFLGAARRDRKADRAGRC